jgi:hypothetical protein
MMPEMTAAELIELIEALAAELNQRARGQSSSTPEQGGFPLMLRPPTEPLDPMDLPFLNCALRGVTLHAPAPG